MAGITTAMCYTFKQEILQGGHCFNAPVATTATVTSASTTMTSVGTLAGVSVGMLVSGANIAANTVVAAITSASGVTLSLGAASTGAGAAVTFTGDVFKMALIRAAVAGTYSGANSNYGDILNSTDEVSNSGTNYTTGGTAMTNVTPTLQGGSVAITNFSPNPTWVTATFSTVGCMIYNAGNTVNGTSGATVTSTRAGGTSGTSTNSNTTGLNRACGVFDFGGTQTVSAGTFTVVMPTFTAASAILRIQ